MPASASSSDCPRAGITKSMMQVVPPATPDAVPDSKSSADTVPMNGNSMCTCGSMKPGNTYWPPASTSTSLAERFSRSSAMATIRPSSQ